MRRWLKAMLPALAVLVPALVLAFLGLRSYKAEQMLAESRFERSLRSITDLMAAGLEESAVAAIRDMVDMARSGVPTDVRVKRVRSRHAIVGEVFILGRQGHLLYPAISKRHSLARRKVVLPIVGSASAAADTARSGASLVREVAFYHRRVKRELEARRFFGRAELAEVSGRLRRAYGAYRAVVQRSARLAPSAYLGMARVAVAQGMWREAAFAQSVLLHRYGTRRDWAGVPYALIGRVGLFTVAERCRGGASPSAGGGRPIPPRSSMSSRLPSSAAHGPLGWAPSGRSCPKGLGDPQELAMLLYTDLVHDRLRTELHTRIYYLDWIRRRIRPPASAEGRRRLAELDAGVKLLRVGIHFAVELGRSVAESILRQAGYRPRGLRLKGFRGGRALLVVQSLGSKVGGFVLRRERLEESLRRLGSRRQLPEGYMVRLQRLPVPPGLRSRARHVRPLGEVLGDLGLAIFRESGRESDLPTGGVAQYLGLVAGLVFVLVAGMLTMYRGVRQ